MVSLVRAQIKEDSLLNEKYPVTFYEKVEI